MKCPPPLREKPHCPLSTRALVNGCTRQTVLDYRKMADGERGELLMTAGIRSPIIPETFIGFMLMSRKVQPECR